MLKFTSTKFILLFILFILILLIGGAYLLGIRNGELKSNPVIQSPRPQISSYIKNLTGQISGVVIKTTSSSLTLKDNNQDVTLPLSKNVKISGVVVSASASAKPQIFSDPTQIPLSSTAILLVNFTGNSLSQPSIQNVNLFIHPSTKK